MQPKLVNTGLVLLLLLMGFSGIISAQERPSRKHTTYFKNTPNELNIYRLYGRFDGPTVFILGGIQGDEPGGFLSADLYPNLVLEKGNLIVVPRANFHSIIKNMRGVNGDMNRRFDHHSPPSQDIDGQIVGVIKQLMAESDLFLNLHDGWGFYSDTWQSQGRNPYRFGQSIIADDSHYVFRGDTIQLEKMARQVVTQVNKKIERSDHHMHFMNTRSFSKQSRYPGMQKSATFFALTQFGIPAFGIETSKNLSSLELKIRYHNYAINEFLKLMQVEPEHPAIIYEPPKLIYMLISINNTEPRVVDNNQSLRILRGDEIRVTHIESNYKRGLSCDIVDVGSEQDFNKAAKLTESTSIIARKDNKEIGKVDIQVSQINKELITYIFKVNNEKKAILDGQTLYLKRGDQFEIVDVIINGLDSKFTRVNLKGYVPPISYNVGEDRGYLIDTDALIWRKYSVYGFGEVYPILVTRANMEISRAYIHINE